MSCRMPYFNFKPGVQIYFETHGQARSVLILLHGLGSDSRVWRSQIECLSKQFTVYVLDFPGHGNSSRDKALYSSQGFSDVLYAFMTAEHIPSAHLLGLSISCSVVLLFAIQHPDKVLSLILNGPAGGIFPYSHPLGWITYVAVTAYLGVMGLLYKLLGQPFLSELACRVCIQTICYHPVLSCMHAAMDPAALKPFAYENGCPPYIDKLHRVPTVPVLIIRGQGDLWPRAYTRYIQNHLPRHCNLVELPGARHVSSLDQPELFNKTLLTFVSRVEQSGLKTTQLDHMHSS